MGLAVARLERTANPLDRHRRRSERWQVPGADPVLDILRSIEAVFAADFEAIHREWSTARVGQLSAPAVGARGQGHYQEWAATSSFLDAVEPPGGATTDHCRRCYARSLASCSQPMTRVCCSSGTNWRDGLAASAAIPVAARIERSGLRPTAVGNSPSTMKHPQPIVTFLTCPSPCWAVRNRPFA